MKSAAVIQAAGKGSRFHSGQYKLLSPVNGKPMVIQTLVPVLAAGFDNVVIVIGAHADEMWAALKDLPVRVIENRDWELGQSTSLSAGMCAIQHSSDRVCLLLGDQPFLKAETLCALLEESDKSPSWIISLFRI